jgi:HAD superfamily hydrolase (TIGR01509 family)
VPALIFDYDGLIVDSERVQAERMIEVIAGWGATVTFEDIGHLFGTVDAGPIWDELLQGWCGRTRADLDAEVWPHVVPLKDALPLLPGVRELLDAAHEAGWKVGLGTGNQHDILERRLGRHGIHHRFDAIVTRVEVPNGKPAPDIYLEVARRLDVPPSECLVLEDSVPGCEAAIAAGMRVIACPSVVSAHLTFPDAARRVMSLLEVDLRA